jgi:hypothetical protein
MAKQAQYLQEGWITHGPGRCKCPRCLTVCSTNALARSKHRCPPIVDANGQTLAAGDTVRDIGFGADALLRKVEAVGCYAWNYGYVVVSGRVGWKSSKRFERVEGTSDET